MDPVTQAALAISHSAASFARTRLEENIAGLAPMQYFPIATSSHITGMQQDFFNITKNNINQLGLHAQNISVATQADIERATRVSLAAAGLTQGLIDEIIGDVGEQTNGMIRTVFDGAQAMASTANNH